MHSDTRAPLPQQQPAPAHRDPPGLTGAAAPPNRVPAPDWVLGLEADQWRYPGGHPIRIQVIQALPDISLWYDRRWVWAWVWVLDERCRRVETRQMLISCAAVEAAEQLKPWLQGRPGDLS